MTASANMKTLGALLACLVLITVLPAGCDQPADISPGAGMGDPYPAPLNDPQITIRRAMITNTLNSIVFIITSLNYIYTKECDMIYKSYVIYFLVTE